jgi:hypothetical protein
VVVVGDVGGHATELRRALLFGGADPVSFAIPDGTVFVQAGDLVHRGPDSALVVRMVDWLLRSQPGKWVQLSGNHDGIYLGGHGFVMPEYLSAADRATVRAWRADGLISLAAALDGPGCGPLLVTHAGLTVGVHDLVGRPGTAGETAGAVNRLLDDDPEIAWRAGAMLGERTGFTAGPCWAEAGTELYAGWLWAKAEGRPGPGFGQVHGHSSAWDWHRREARAPSAVAARLSADPVRRHVRGTFHGRPFGGIDPGFGKRAPSFSWEPLVLDGARVVG